MAKNILVLTATVTPPHDAAQLQRVDPLLRLQDYATALEFYLKQMKLGVISSIIFSDNSNSDLKMLRDLVGKFDANDQVEFIPFEGLDYPPSFGRGYGEFKMLDYVMEHSRIIREAGSNANVWKITGRYVLENIGKVVGSKPASVEFYCNCRNIPKYWIDLYVLCWTKHYYEECIKGIYMKLREDAGAGSAEPAFRKVLELKNSPLSVAKRFAIVPILQGYRGFDNRNYKEMGFKLFLRRLALVLVPWVWI